MEGLKDILTFCVGFGIITLCVVLIVSGILRWLAPCSTRARRLDILAWIVVAALSAASLLYFTWGPGSNDSTKAMTFLNVSSKLFMILALGVIAASATVLLVIIAIYLYNILRVITHTGDQIYVRDSRLDKFIQPLRSRAVILAVAWGIMALFLILPLFAGMPTIKTNEASETSKAAETNEISEASETNEINGLIEIWENGVNKIGCIFGKDKNKSTFDAFVTYTLIYIIVLGVGLAAIKILHSIITQSIKKTHKDIIEEYSDPIGLLAVGVAVLWSLKEGGFTGKNASGIVLELLESFVAVAVIATLVILVLEVIRLLMDMKEPFIRQEARYLFVALVGECAIVVMEMVFTFCGALSNAIGGRGHTFAEFEEKVRDKMERLMKKQLDAKASEQPDNNNDHERIFAAFDQKITRK